MCDLEKMKEEYLKNKKMSLEELNKTVGGANTGDFDENGEVYIVFPGIASFLTGYYNTKEIEDLAVQYSAYKVAIRMAVTPAIKSAVQSVYSREGKTIPDNVKDLLGM